MKNWIKLSREIFLNKTRKAEHANIVFSKEEYAKISSSKAAYAKTIIPILTNKDDNIYK